MSQKPVSGKNLTQRFNKYVAYRLEHDRGRSGFLEKLSQEGKKGEVTKQEKPFEASVEREVPKFAPPREISNAQARRLARYAPLIQDAASKHNVPVELICGVMLQESNCHPRAVSSAGARGLMQLMPKTAERFGVNNSFDPEQNIHGGTKYLRSLLDRFDGDIELTLAAYNAGEGAVEKHGNRVPPYRETKEYIPKVLGYTQSMIDILLSPREKSEDLPSHARRV